MECGGLGRLGTDRTGGGARCTAGFGPGVVCLVWLGMHTSTSSCAACSWTPSTSLIGLVQHKGEICATVVLPIWTIDPSALHARSSSVLLLFPRGDGAPV